MAGAVGSPRPVRLLAAHLAQLGHELEILEPAELREAAARMATVLASMAG